MEQNKPAKAKFPKIPRKRGPKTKHKTDTIDREDILKLAAMQCTMEEIAAFFDCSVDTIERNFADLIKAGRSKGVTSMKRALFEKVQRGDLGAMVWWGKNFAGMAERVHQELTGRGGGPIESTTAVVIIPAEEVET